MAFTIATNITKEVERMVLGEEPSMFVFFEVFRRHLIYPIKIVLKGIDIGMIEFAKFSIIYFILLFLYLGMLNDMPQELRAIFGQMYLPLVFIVPLFISLFPAPSTFCTYGVKEKHIGFAIEIIKKYKLDNRDDIESVRKNVQIFEVRTLHKIRILKAILALGWTGFIYLYGKIQDLVTQSPIKVHEADFMAVGIIGAVLLISFVIIEGYSKGCALIFKSTIFGLSEYEYGASNKAVESDVNLPRFNSNAR